MKLLRDLEQLAFDRASVRQLDEDGRLHVLEANISKANVCPYRGAEIPNWQALGLDADRVYRMLRHPDELAKAAPTFNRLPILNSHVHVTADAHRHDITIGATGSECVFDGEYLRNSLTIWPRDAIALIEKDIQKELSSAYHYDADMTPGNFKGVAYDGVMRNIRGNHVAVVRKGRAGSDVVVGDEAPRHPRLYGVGATKFKKGFI